MRRCIESYTGLQVGFHLGLSLHIWDPIPLEGHDGICRVSVKSHASIHAEHWLPHHGLLQHHHLLFRCPRYLRLWCTWTRMPHPTTYCTWHLVANRRPRGGYVFHRETWEGMCHLQALIDLEPLGDPWDPFGAHKAQIGVWICFASNGGIPLFFIIF